MLLSADKDMQLGRIFEDRCAEMYYRVRILSCPAIVIWYESFTCSSLLGQAILLNTCDYVRSMRVLPCTGKNVWLRTSLLGTGGGPLSRPLTALPAAECTAGDRNCMTPVNESTLTCPCEYREASHAAQPYTHWIGPAFFGSQVDADCVYDPRSCKRQDLRSEHAHGPCRLSRCGHPQA